MATKTKRMSIKTLDREIERKKKEISLGRLQQIGASYSKLNSNGYTAGNTGRREFRNWSVAHGTADMKYLYDLTLIRDRATDLYRNSAIASGAIKTAANNVIGSGLTLQSSVDREYLSEVIGWSDDAFDKWEATVERKWRNYWESIEVDAMRRMSGPELEFLAYLNYKNEGETFALLPRFVRSGSKYNLKVHLFGAGRVSNPWNKYSDKNMRDGIEIDDRGVPVRYYFQKDETLFEFNKTWVPIKAFGSKSGRRNVLHIYKPDSIGQTRGLPWITTVIPNILSIKEYSDHERTRAAVSALFVGFVKSNRANALDDPFANDPQVIDGSRAVDRERDYTLSPGVIHQLLPDEEMQFGSPNSPNAQFDAFIRANLREIGMSLQIPIEMLIKEFNSSYTASKASRIEAFRYFLNDRSFFARNFNQPVFQEWLMEQVCIGEIDAPGFVEDEEIRSAFCSTQWIGESQGQIDPVRETTAAIMRMENGLSTAHSESIMIGQDFDKNIKKIPRERRLLREAGLLGDQPMLFPEDSKEEDSNNPPEESQTQKSARLVGSVRSLFND